MKKIYAFISKPHWSFIGVVIAVYGIFLIPDFNIMEFFKNYEWIFEATKWSLIFGASIFAIHAYVRAEKNINLLKNIKGNPYDEAYKDFTTHLTFALARYKGYSSNLSPKERKFTEVGVFEQITEARRARLLLLSVCGEQIQSLLLEFGTDWLKDINIFVEKAPLVEQKLSEIALKDRTNKV